MPGQWQVLGAAGLENMRYLEFVGGHRLAQWGRKGAGRPMERKPSVELGAFLKWHSAFSVSVK